MNLIEYSVNSYLLRLISKSSEYMGYCDDQAWVPASQRYAVVRNLYRGYAIRMVDAIADYESEDR